MNSDLISAHILKDSINNFGDRVTTFRLTYHRYILAEVNTHRNLSKNTSSSRAIPVSSNIERVLNNPAVPIVWGKNKAGMSSNEILDDDTTAYNSWIEASKLMSAVASRLSKIELHKQFANRLLEPFLTVDTILTGTEFNNFFNLRISSDAQPEICDLAMKMYIAYKNSTPTLLYSNQWHLPYIDTIFDEFGNIKYFVNDQEIDLDTAIKISVSCCAQVSYRKLDTSIEKALQIYERLTSNKSLHASPFEHVCTPFSNEEHSVRIAALNMMYESLPDLSSIDLNLFMYKRNFKGWTQYRTLMPNDTNLNEFVI